MADLVAELARRNARLRAWRAHGAPVEGGWRIERWRDGARGALDLGCTTCGKRTVDQTSYHPVSLPLIERSALRYLNCPHLAALLSEEDPPAVQALTQLELLAGDPPR